VFDERTELAVVYQVPLSSVKYSVWMARVSAKFWRENRTDRNQSIMVTKLRRIKFYFWILVLAAMVNIPICILLSFRGTLENMAIEATRKPLKPHMLLQLRDTLSRSFTSERLACHPG
jgi:hypothetical protein